jgi:hypothetical protein
MGYDPRLFERVLDALARKEGWTEKDMYGGRVCIRNGRPFIGTLDDGVIALCDDDSRAKHLVLKHCSPFMVNGKEQSGWVKVALDALKTAKQLSRWVEASYSLASTLPPPKPAAKPAAKKAPAKKAPAKKPTAKPKAKTRRK